MSVVIVAILGILPRTARVNVGRILFHDPVLAADRAETMLDIAGLATDSPQMRAIRGARICIVFQEPMTSLSPVHTVGTKISETLHLHRKVRRAEGESLVREMTHLVGSPGPAEGCKTQPSGKTRRRRV